MRKRNCLGKDAYLSKDAYLGQDARDAAWRDRRLRALIQRVEEDPSVVLSDPRCLKPQFCEAYLDLCDDKCLRVGYEGALEYAGFALQLVEKVGDSHLIHRGHGVLAHAHIANCDWPAADDVLQANRQSALDCCAFCASDWLRRHGDLLVETGDAEAAREALEQAADKLGPNLDDDLEGRIGFLRGIAFHKKQEGERALDEAGQALLKLAMTTPKGYFMEALAFVACFLQFRAERPLYAKALSYLKEFRQRIKGREGWTEVRLRSSWVEALILARLGERKKAVERLERVLKALIDTAPPKHVLAVTIDLTQLFARRASDTDLRAIRRLIGRCRRLEIDSHLRRGLKTIKQVSSQRPEQTLDALSRFRFTFKAPVPGLLSEGRFRV